MCCQNQQQEQKKKYKTPEDSAHARVCLHVLSCAGVLVRSCFIYVFLKHIGFVFQQWQMVLNNRQRQEAHGSQHGM